MKDIYDLTTLLPMSTFPWEDVVAGMSRSRKKASIFYGVTKNKLQLTPEESMWHAALSKGELLHGLDILLTVPKDPAKWPQAWYQLGYNDFWQASLDYKHFASLQQWLASTGAFKETGRQILFIQIQASNTPLHVDENPLRAPAGYQGPAEFIWITNPTMGKQLVVNEQQAPTACWFNSYVPHQTLPAPGLRWSLRIDGKFTDEFKDKLKQL